VNDIDRLVAIEAIKQLFARYYYALDHKNWDEFEALFTPDAVMDMRDPSRILTSEEGVYRGAAAIRAFAVRAIGAGHTIDKGVMPIIEVTTPTTATGIWAQEDRVDWPDGHPNRSLHGHGYEHQTYEKLDGQWKIKSTRMERLRVDIVRSDPA
jgi:hypothetical protein